MNPSGASAEKDDPAEKYGEAVLDVVVEGEGASNEVQPEREGPSSDFWKNKLKEFVDEHLKPKADVPSTPIIVTPYDPQLIYHSGEDNPSEETVTTDALGGYLSEHPELREWFAAGHSVLLRKMPREEFANEWEHSHFAYRQHLLEARKGWVTMKKEGDEFLRALETRMLDLAQGVASDTNEGESLFRLICLYESLATPNEHIFLAKLLSYEQIWNNGDGSNVHHICASMKPGDPSIASALLGYLDHILSPEYARAQQRSADLGYCVGALVRVAGDEATQILNERAEKSTTFQGCWEYLKSSSLSFTFSIHKMLAEKTPPPPFNAEEEEAYLGVLENEIEKQSTDFPHLAQDGSSMETPIDLDTLYEVDESEEPSHKAINFYGRFRPKVERPVTLTEENTLRAISGLVKTPERTAEEYLNVLSGIVEEGMLLGEVSNDWAAGELRALSEVVSARAVLLSVLEGDRDRAVNEVNQALALLDTFQQGKGLTHLRAEAERAQVGLRATLGNLRHVESAHNNDPLPDSAKPFFVYHERFKKLREIPAFEDLLKEKIRYLLARELSGDERYMLRSGDWCDRASDVYRDQMALYKNVSENDVPVYWEALDKIDETDAFRCVVFGRDGKYLFTALKANDFGVGRREQKYVLVTSKIGDHENKTTIATYLRQQGVELDSYFIDTGFRGSIPELAIKALAEAGGVEVSAEEIDRRIKLLSSSQFGRQSIAAQAQKRSRSNPVDTIEDRPQSIHSPSRYQLTPNGKLVPEERPTDPLTQLSAWVVEHAVMRNFAPRFEPEQRLRPPDELVGHHFLERFSGGSVVATHPMELWEDAHGEKYLLKGGPEHTLRADYVGAQMFTQAQGVKTPHADLVRVNGALRLKTEYFEGWEDGSITLPKRFHESEAIQRGFFIDLLLRQYDRTSWNMMFAAGDNVAFIDHGASLHSRARGGYKGFPMEVTIEDIAEVLEHPERQGAAVNEAYGALVAVENGELAIKDRARVRRLFNDFEGSFGNADDRFNRAIDEAGFSDGRRATERLKIELERLKSELPTLSPGSRDARMHQGAIATLEQMISMGGEATYLKKALSQRARQIVDLFYEKLRGEI